MNLRNIDRCACRPRQDDARGRHALAERDLPRQPGRPGAGSRLDGPRAREGHHDHGEEHRRDLHPAEARNRDQGTRWIAPRRRRQDQHRRHTRARRLRRRGRTHPAHGRRRHAARRRRRGAASPDPRRPAQGPGAGTAGDRGHQQDRPQGRTRRRGPGRDLRPVHRPRRHRGTDRLPRAVRRRPRRSTTRAAAPTSSTGSGSGSASPTAATWTTSKRSSSRSPRTTPRCANSPILVYGSAPSAPRPSTTNCCAGSRSRCFGASSPTNWSRRRTRRSPPPGSRSPSASTTSTSGRRPRAATAAPSVRIRGRLTRTSVGQRAGARHGRRGNRRPSPRWISRHFRSSSGVMKVTASPELPIRPVRPTRWVKSRWESGRS